MQKIYKSLVCAELTKFTEAGNGNTWDDFRNFKSGALFELVRSKLFEEQNWLCAYCEVEIDSREELKHKRRVEHFHSKSDQVNVDDDITFNWSNLLGVCLGGTDDRGNDKSCDSSKESKESVTKNKNWHGEVLFPPDIPEDIQLFDFDLQTGNLKPHKENCLSKRISNNKHQSTEALVSNTIDVFNLNCERLNNARRQLLFERERIIKITRLDGNKERLKHFYDSWKTNSGLSFSTTRKILAENK